jgi:hypothetical protein
LAVFLNGFSAKYVMPQLLWRDIAIELDLRLICIQLDGIKLFFSATLERKPKGELFKSHAVDIDY